MFWFYWEMTPLCSYAAPRLECGTWMRQSTEWKNSTFSTWKWTSDLEVDSRPALRAVTSLLMLVFPPFRSLFLRPIVSGSHFFDVVLEYRYADFSGIFSGNVPVFCAIWLDSGYMFASVYEVTVSVWQQRLVRTVQTVQLAAWTRVLACPLLCRTLFKSLRLARQWIHVLRCDRARRRQR